MRRPVVLYSRAALSLMEGRLAGRMSTIGIQTMTIDQTIRIIAADKLNLETLETRYSDSLDFSDQAVWNIEAALRAAYRAGELAAKGTAA